MEIINPSSSKFLGGTTVTNLMLVAVFAYTLYKAVKK